MFVTVVFYVINVCQYVVKEKKKLICPAIQWNGFYMIGVSVIKELNKDFFPVYMICFSTTNSVFISLKIHFSPPKKR